MVILAQASRTARAGVSGSPHDFSATGPFTRSATLAPAGPCSACHIPHGALDLSLWPRTLQPYRDALSLNGSINRPDYLRSGTLSCYDCHDYHDGGGTVSQFPNDVPAHDDFDIGHRPQNILFGFRKDGTGSMTEDGYGDSSLDLPGYYENKPPYSGAGANYGADPNLDPTAPPYPNDNTDLLKTGGHYFKRKDPTGIGSDAFDIGDKLPCRDCHDPHAWDTSWQVFMRKSWPTGTVPGRLGSSSIASSSVANAPVSGSRSDSDSRSLCTACHGTSDTQNPVNFTDISAQYSSSAGTIVRPPNTVGEHANSSNVACVLCHKHNTVDAPSGACSSCHLSSGADSDQYLDGTDTWYQNDAAAVIDNAEWGHSGHGRVAGTYDVSGRPAANLLGGGTGDNPCLYCHDSSTGHKDSANPFRLKDQTGVSGYASRGWNATCLVCHGKTPAPPGYDPDGSGTVYANKVAAAAFADNAHYGTDHGAGNNGGAFCWDCHDPHGDRNASGTGNIHMVHRQRVPRKTDGTYGFIGSAGALSSNAPVFTDNATGTDYADNTALRGICQVCHATTLHYTAASGDGHYAGTRCTTCHSHDKHFAPTDCLGCHGGDDGSRPGINGAPVVTKYWKTSGHGKNVAIACEDCHDVGSPAGQHVTDGTGTFNTLNWPGKGSDTTNANTSHLKSFFFPSNPSPTAADYARTFDNTCNNRLGCHRTASGRSVGEHSVHEYRTEGYFPNGLTEFGMGTTPADPKSHTWYTPIDPVLDFYRSRSPWVVRDTNSGIAAEPPEYGICVTCHDPHGTATADTCEGSVPPSNAMMRGNWRTESMTFCSNACHI